MQVDNGCKLLWQNKGVLHARVTLSLEVLLRYCNPLCLGWIIGVLGVIAVSLWAFNRHRAQSAILSFEDEMPEQIMTLGIASMPNIPTRTIEKLS